MDFTLNEEQKMLQSMVRDFAEKKLAPVADKIEQAEEFPMGHFKALAEIGMTGYGIPAEYGGSGGDNVGFVVALEEIARACASTCDIVDAHLSLGTEPIYIYGTEEQRRKFVVPLAKGDKIGSFAITEPNAGSDVSAIETTAVKDGNNYILNGTKVFMTLGDVSDYGVVFANIPSMGKRGMTAFIVEAGMPGFTRGKKYSKLGMRAATNADFIFEDCKVPAANRLGEEGQGMKICLGTLDHGRLGIAAQCIGITRAVLEKSAEYAKQRVQFGQPIANNQAIQWMIADIAAGLDAARLLLWRAASLADKHEKFTVAASMAKLMASALCMQASIKGVQIHGGYGYMMDSPMQRYMRDA
ncbi:MAG: acyl-CoA dehydrogenase family protein, partial [Dehalococcoidales bacterium]|nr:acyl-CoA dehydrogenase family protein [Dehalococcoidales bacterium]